MAKPGLIALRVRVGGEEHPSRIRCTPVWLSENLDRTVRQPPLISGRRRAGEDRPAAVVNSIRLGVDVVVRIGLDTAGVEENVRALIRIGRGVLHVREPVGGPLWPEARIGEDR